MAQYLSNYLIDALLNFLFRGTVSAPFTGASAPATLYLALFTTKPAADGTGGVELSGNGYTRLAITPSTSEYAAPATSGSNRVTKNAVLQAWSAVTTAQWANVVGVGVYDAATLGNLWLYGDLASPATIPVGETFDFPVNNFQFGLNNA